MSLHRTRVQNCPLLFRLRPAQINDRVTKSAFSCKGPSCEEAELSDFSCFLPSCAVEISYMKATHNHLAAWTIRTDLQDCANCNDAPFSNYHVVGEHQRTSSHPKDESRTSSGCKGNNGSRECVLQEDMHLSTH